MVNQSLFEAYERLNTTYYYNFEYYYYQAVRQLLPGSLDLRDVLILSTIEQMEKTSSNTSTQIAQQVTMSASAFSNYLRTLEKETLVQRARGVSNRKLMYVTLTLRGRELNKIIKRFIQGLIKELGKEFGVVDSLKYLNVVLTTSHNDPFTPAPKLSLFSQQNALKIITEALRNINFIIYTQHEQVLSTLTPSMTSREMRLLHGVLHLSKEGEVTPSNLGQYLGYPMSTMTSMLKGIEDKHYIHRSTVTSDLRKLLITLTPEATTPLETFMFLRLKTIDDILPKLTASEQRLLERSFQILKNYSLQSMAK